MKHVIFLLPGHGRIPCGGFKVVYEYANRLIGSCSVEIAYLSELPYTSKFRSFFRYYFYYNRFRSKWFKLDDRIRISWINRVGCNTFPVDSIIIATSWETCEKAAILSNSQKIYLIQGDEASFDSVVNNNQVDKVGKTIVDEAFTKVVISSFLYNMLLDNYKIKSQILFNGVDHNVFCVTNNIESRAPNSIILMYHVLKSKGADVGISALKSLKERGFNLNVIMFGAYPKPLDLPDWITYFYKPSTLTLSKLYNSNSIFISTSFTEGWGLTVVEAMCCGCANLVTNISGYSDFAFDQKTAVLYEAGNVRDLEQKLILLIQNDNLRINLAKTASEYVLRYDWDLSTNNFKNILQL